MIISILQYAAIKSDYSGTPLKRPPKMVAFQKKWPVIRGKIHMICKEWYIEMGQILQL